MGNSQRSVAPILSSRPARSVRTRATWVSAGALVACSVTCGLLSGCGPGGTPEESPTPSDESPTGVPTPPDVTPTSEAETPTPSDTPGQTPTELPSTGTPLSSGTPDFIDQDGDGFSETQDCDDSNPNVYPGADEVCDGLDNSCDDVVDDQACVWRVSASSPSSSPTGLSWTDAFVTLTDALLRAEPGDQVWVAGGTYLAPAPNAPVLTLEPGVEMYGGFEGTERALEERPSTLAQTVLDGDFDQSGGPSDSDSFHVVLGAANARLDGFILQGGRAEGTGSGIGTGTETNTAEGGGLYVAEANALVLANLTVQHNRATTGGGLFIYHANLILEQVTLVDNSASESGGGIAAVGAPVDLVDTALSQNRASRGGGIDAVESALTLDGVLLQENRATTDGAGIHCSRSTLTGKDSILEANEAGQNGGGIYSSLSPLTLTTSSLTGNTASSGAGLYLEGGSVSISSSELKSNLAQTRGGGIFSDAATLQLANVILVGNRVGTEGGALYTTSGFLSLQLVTLTENEGGQEGGGIKSVTSQLTLENSILWGNLTAGGEPELGVGADSVLRISSSCVARHADGTTPAGVSSDTSNVLLDPALGSPFALADRNRDGQPEYYLRHAGLGGETVDSPCVDAGDAASATAAGIPWASLTTRTDGQPDDGALDLGRHY